MAKHYTIDESKKIIYADILKLTEKEMNEVERFRRMGYSVENKTTNKAEVKRLNDEFILEFLADGVCIAQKNIYIFDYIYRNPLDNQARISKIK